MQIEEARNLLPPSICIICEEQPYSRVVDTLRDFRPSEVGFIMAGRKYVCERCVHEFARLFDYVLKLDVVTVYRDKANAERELALYKATVVAELNKLQTIYVGGKPALVASGERVVDDPESSPENDPED